MEQVFVELLERNATHADEFDSRFDDVQDGQAPDAVTVSCSDSRVLQDHAWGNDEPGRLFSVSNIGNRVLQRTEAGEVVSGDVLYPIEHTGTEVAVVVGHTGCGAVTATYDALTGALDEPPGIEHCVDVLADRLAAGVDELADDVMRSDAINRLVEYNVDRQVDALVGSDSVPAGVTVAGVVYDFQDVYEGQRGEVHVINVDGERSVESLRSSYPAIAERVQRVWEY